MYVSLRVCLCVSGFSDACSDEPSAKQAKIEDAADISGGLPSMLKTKITEVLAVIFRIIFVSVFQLNHKKLGSCSLNEFNLVTSYNSSPVMIAL